MKTAIEAAKKLGISSDEFERIVRDYRIKLVFNGNQQLIQKEDYQHLKSLLKKQIKVISSSETNLEKEENLEAQSAIDLGQQDLLVSELRDQIGFLKSQVEAERAQNTELIEQVSQWQKLMMNFQSENLKLRQEIEKYKKHISNNLVSTSMSEVSADELASGQLYSGEKLNGFPVTEQQESQQTTGAQAIIENLLRKTFPWGMPSRLPSNVKQELSSHLAEQGLGISDSRLNSIVSSIRKNW
ncbi:MAG: hypothetical protein VW492_17405 [Deltaproteobacteria bacterium]|jgi:hypothetical protein